MECTAGARLSDIPEPQEDGKMRTKKGRAQERNMSVPAAGQGGGSLNLEEKSPPNSNRPETTKGAQR
jgi:hypothetical protein